MLLSNEPIKSQDLLNGRPNCYPTKSQHLLSDLSLLSETDIDVLDNLFCLIEHHEVKF